MIEGKRPPREDVDPTDSLGEECVGGNEVRGRGGKGGGKKRSGDEKGSGDSAPSQLDDNASTSHVDSQPETWLIGSNYIESDRTLDRVIK